MDGPRDSTCGSVWERSVRSGPNGWTNPLAAGATTGSSDAEGRWQAPVTSVGWALFLYTLPAAAGLLAARTWRHLPDWPPAARGLAAGLLGFLLLRDASFTFTLGADLAGWLEGLLLQAAFLAGVLLPPFTGYVHPALPAVRRAAWTWIAALGLHGAAESWAVPAALAGGTPEWLPAAAVALRQLAAAWGAGLLLSEARVPSGRELAWAVILAGAPAIAVAAARPVPALMAWAMVLRAGAAGLLLAGLVGGRLTPGTHGENAGAEWGFALALASGLAIMYGLSRLQGVA